MSRIIHSATVPQCHMHCRGFTILSAAAYLLVPIEKATMQPLALCDFVSIEQLMNLEVAAKTVHHVIECDGDRVILTVSCEDVVGVPWTLGLKPKLFRFKLCHCTCTWVHKAAQQPVWDLPV